MALFLDIETTAIKLGTLPDRIHFCAISEDGAEARMVDRDELQELLYKHREVIAHNGVFFDFPVLKKVWDIDFTGVVMTDTLLMSFVCAPHLQRADAEHDLQPKKYRGRHSLKAWGLRLNFPKDDYTGGWDEPNEEMRVYCLRDVDVLVRLYNTLTGSMFFNSDVLFREHRVHFLMADIFLKGVPVFGLDDLREMIVGDMDDAIAEIRGMGYEGNINSRQQVAHFLQTTMSWEPDEFTPTGKPKVNHDTMKEFPAFVKYYATQKPLSQLATIAKKVFDGSIYPTISTSSTRTGRCSHSNPNVGQIPAVQEADSRWEAKYGQEFRALFRAPDGYRLVGADLSSLELRCMAEALYALSGSSVWIDMLEAGADIHKQNQELLGLVNRTDAKRFIFAAIYGAGPDKIGLLLNMPRLEAFAVLLRAKAKIPGYSKAKQTLEQQARVEKSVILPNGRRLMCFEPFTAFNTFLQGLGSEVAKYWMLNIQDRIDAAGIDARLVLFVHDELQYICHEEDVDKLTVIIYDAVKLIAGQLKTRMTFACEVKTGMTWKETH